MGYDFYFGSRTAKGGFDNEKIVADKFKNWKNDEDAQEWLKIMGYKLEEIQELKAIVIPVRLSKKEIECFGLNKEEDIEFKKEDINTLKGFVGIGHVRYPTIGTSFLRMHSLF